MELIIALLITLSMTGAAWAQQTQPFSCASTAPGNVNVREEANEDATIVATIPPGGSVTGNGYDESGQWLNVITTGQTGWASAQFFSCETPLPPTVTVLITATPTMVVTATTAATTATPMPTSLSATDTPLTGETFPTLCVSVFDDLNANGLRDDGDGDPQRASFTLDSEAPSTSSGLAMSGCSTAAAGLHVVEVSMPAGRQASISARWNVSVRSGQLIDLLVGAASPEALAARRQATDSTPAVPGTIVMAGAGGLLIAVVGVGWLFTRSGRKNA